ncbi:MAG TPA: hypothetical protein V6C76_15875 [Drouetiella sp.]
MRQLPVDRLTLAFILVTAVAAILIAVIFNNIIDRSYDRVKQVREDKSGADPTSEIASELVKNADNAKKVFSDTKGLPNQLRISDETLKSGQFEDMAKRWDITKLKLLRCEYDPKDFAKLKDMKIKAIGLSDCLVDKTVIDNISQMPKLNQLEMFRCDIADNAFENIATSKITLLKFRKCGPDSLHAKLTVRQIKDISRMSNLETWDLSKNDFEPGALRHLEDVQCEMINLSNTSITDEDLKSVRKMPRLKYLHLNNPPHVTCEGLKNLQGAKLLKHIEINPPLLNCKELGDLKRISDTHSGHPPDKLQFDQM